MNSVRPVAGVSCAKRTIGNKDAIPIAPVERPRLHPLKGLLCLPRPSLIPVRPGSTADRAAFRGHKNPIDSQGTATTIANATASAAR